MVKTRTRTYRRRRLWGSPCRKRRATVCKSLDNCSWAKGKKRSFCRRRNNKSRRSKK